MIMNYIKYIQYSVYIIHVSYMRHVDLEEYTRSFSNMILCVVAK